MRDVRHGTAAFALTGRNGKARRFGDGAPILTNMVGDEADPAPFFKVFRGRTWLDLQRPSRADVPEVAQR